MDKVWVDEINDMPMSRYEQEDIVRILPHYNIDNNHDESHVYFGDGSMYCSDEPNFEYKYWSVPTNV